MIKEETPAANTRKLLLDLASLKQVREAAQEVLDYKESTIDVLINNAAIVGILTARGANTDNYDHCR